MDQLTLLGEKEAVRLFFDSRNARVLFRLLSLFTLWAVVETIFWLSNDQPLEAARSLVSLALIRWLYFVRDRPFLTRHFRPVLLAYLSLQLPLVRHLALDPPAAGLQPYDYLLPWVLLFFRLPRGQAAIPLAALWIAAAGRNLAVGLWTGQAVDFWPIVGQSAISVIVLLAVGRLTRKRHATFLATWRREHRRHREQRRMREELDDARRIQLSMLPPSDPMIPWLDVAGISIPASEVGGDYFDYFAVSESRQTVVIADVAGHGVASALLLSGLRSCLYLLHESPTAPVEILTRLDRMVRRTTAKRSFVTMLYAAFDYERKEVTLSVAGHPPMLCYRPEKNAVEEIGLQALPLGTALGNALAEKTVPFRRGDVFLLYTDGIAETLDRRQNLYGNERLRRRLQDVSRDRGAKEIRDTLLGDVWNFKGDSEQTDDITLVVVKAL